MLPRLTLHREAPTDVLRFEGAINLVVAHGLGLAGRLMLNEADKPRATMGDKLRALAELFDAAEGRNLCRLERPGLPCGCPVDKCRKGHVT